MKYLTSLTSHVRKLSLRKYVAFHAIVLHWHLQSIASELAKHCDGTCKAPRCLMQSIAITIVLNSSNSHWLLDEPVTKKWTSMSGSFLLFVNPFTLFSEAIVNVCACCGYHCNHGKHNVRYHNLLTFPVLGVGSRLTAFALHLASSFVVLIIFPKSNT